MDVVDPIEVALAQEAVDAFCRQFGTPGSQPYQAYRDFARHAALPLTFTADLLYRLQDRFRQDMRGNALHIPWVAVADLMLSHLCHEVRPETFRLDEQVQALLLAELQADRARFWTADGRSSRLQEVAAFLIHYAAHQMNHPSHYAREAAKAERLNAQVIINPEWVRRSLQETAVTLQPQQDPVATLRLASLVNRFNHAVNLTRPEEDTTRQDFNKLQAYTAGQAQLAAGKTATAVAQQFRTTFGSDNNIQIGGQTLPGLGQLVGEPAQPTLPASLSIAFAGYDLTRVLQKGAPLPATSERITLRHEDTKLDQGFGYPAIQILQGESTSVHENYQLGDITLTDESLYIHNELEIEVMLTVTPEGAVHIQLSHHSGYSSELTMFLVDAENLGEPSVIELGALVERFTQGVKEDFHLNALTAVSNWLNTTDSAHSMNSAIEQKVGKTSADSTSGKLTQLRQLLIKHFSLSELHVLCFDLELEFEALLGDTVTTKVQSLIEYFLRRSELNKLLTEVTEQRPFVNWPTFSTTALGTEVERTLIITGERNAGKTTIAALLAQYFRGDRQPPNDLYALAPTSTSAIYFCQPSRPETLHPRSFALTIASQWASRDSHFAYLQSTIDSHKNYELDELVEQMLIRPFTNIDEPIYPASIVFLVDDLEAALQHPGETTIVDVILRMLREVPGVRFLLTTQMQPAVRSKLADVEAEFIHLGDRYDNFDIHVGQPLPGPQQRYPIVVTSETSGQLQDIEQTFAPVTELGYERLARLRDLASSPEETIEIGQRLFSVLMREPNYEMVRRSLEATRSRGKAGLRLRLRFDDPSLQAYPWELCHDGRSFIFNNPDQPILLQRTVGVENYQAPPPLPRPVRLLVAIAAPADQSPADVDLPGKMIRLATEEVMTRSELDVQIIRHATLRELESVVQAYQPNIVQFIGHSRGEKDGVLILENESGRSNLVPVPELTRLLTAAPVQCVILSPIGVGENSLTKLAPQFIQQGIPIVLAEQFPLPDQPATAFWRTFYNTLLFDRLSFEDGVWNGRNHLDTTHREPFWSYITFIAGLLEPTPPLKTTKEAEETQRGGFIWLEEETGFLYQGKQQIDNLRPLERDLLTFFVQNPHKTHTKSEIIQHVWPEGTQIEGVTDDSLYQIVRGVRQKIELGFSQPGYLLTRRGVEEGGYQFFPEGYKEWLVLNNSTKFFESGEIWLDAASDLLFKENNLIDSLSPLEENLLKFLVKNPYMKHTLTEIVDMVWPPYVHREGVTNSSVYQLVRKIRHEIEPNPSSPLYLLSWRGGPEGGYRFFPQGIHGTGKVTTAITDILAGPSKDFPIISVIYQGDSLELLGRSSNSRWLRVILSDKPKPTWGWVKSSDIQTDSVLDRLPVSESHVKTK